MKNAIILPGIGSKSDDFWFPYIQHALRKKSYEVWIPQLPNIDHPNLEESLPFVLQNGIFGHETILIGHSTGARLILSILEKLDVQIKQAVLVSGYAAALPTRGDAEEVGALDWKKIKDKARQITFINSDNDPWGWDDAQGRIMLDHLGGVLIIPKGEGHMGSTTYNQPYTEFPLLLKQLDI